MLFIFEVDSGFQKKPGSFKSTLGGKKFRRVWWLWFALAWWPGDIKEYGEAVRDGEWRDK